MVDLVPGFLGFPQFYGKLAREFHKLKSEGNADNFLNFILTANHMKDWLRRDLDMSPDLIARYDADFTANVQCLRVCNELANAGKHPNGTFPFLKAVSWPPQSWTGTQGINSAEAHVILQDDSMLMLAALTHEIMNYWSGLVGPPEFENRGA
jgi:hypothetical protein